MEQWYLNTPRHVRKELNKVRLAKGKGRIAKPSWFEKQPSSAYMRYALAHTPLLGSLIISRQIRY